LASASVYLSCALLISQCLPRAWQRGLVIAYGLLLAIGIGASRAYLGVHYPSDIVAGLLLGSGWALLVSAAFSFASRSRAD
jgi:undecaprenyl-diphosphatase